MNVFFFLLTMKSSTYYNFKIGVIRVYTLRYLLSIKLQNFMYTSLQLLRNI